MQPRHLSRLFLFTADLSSFAAAGVPPHPPRAAGQFFRTVVPALRALCAHLGPRGRAGGRGGGGRGARQHGPAAGERGLHQGHQRARVHGAGARLRSCDLARLRRLVRGGGRALSCRPRRSIALFVEQEIMAFPSVRVYREGSGAHHGPAERHEAYHGTRDADAIRDFAMQARA